MNLASQLNLVTANLANFGQNRLLALAGAAALVIGLLAAGALYVNQPARETLYVGLDAEDINKIGVALGEMGMDFSVGADGGSISVPAGSTARARMLLAERGLPSSATSGYELFDNVGSLGLTSFMQEITRVRALEGEIGRTIQSIEGVASARVHIVMPDRANFRLTDQSPSASVMIRASSNAGRRAAGSIRHLVAASVPGLGVDEVTVLDSAGQLLASGDDFSNSSLNRSLTVVQTVQNEIETNIEKALSPFLGMENFRTSVTADLNTDTQQIQETIFDPNSRVERSVRVTRENQQSDQSAAAQPATVEQNIPQVDEAADPAGPTSSELTERKEEQTNYEINSKTVATVRNGYDIEKLSIAVVINRARLEAMLGDEASEGAIEAYVAEMQQVVATAAGLDDARGDQVKLTVMEFLGDTMLDEPAGAGMAERLSRHAASMINAGAFVLVALLVVWFGLRPIARSMSARPQADGQPALEDGAEDMLELPDFSPSGVAADGSGQGGLDGAFGLDDPEGLAMMESGPEALFSRRTMKEGPERRLAMMVDINEERAAKILRKWVSEQAA